MRSSPLKYFALAMVTLLAPTASPRQRSADTQEIFPLKQIRPGMKGVAYTIFSGDQIEKMDVEVIGILPNALGPKTDVVLVELKGPKVQHSGVVAGMSGSPVYIDGKLVGAIALKLGIFSKEAIAGVMPIEEMLDVGLAVPADVTPTPPGDVPPGRLAPVATGSIALSGGIADRAGLHSRNYLIPIETPLVFSGLYPQALGRFADQFAALGFSSVMAGGDAPPRPDDARIQPGDMVGMRLAGGDLSLTAGCTVTAIIKDRVFVCGHPLFGSGAVQLPMVRGHVLTTLNSELESTKLMTTTGVIGTFTQDRLTAVMGRLGPGPRMIPMDVELDTPSQQRKFHFELIENAKLTPLLVGVVTFNGIIGNTAYSEGETLELEGTIALHGHSLVHIENVFAPTDAPAPDGFFVASQVQSAFARIFSNPYEQPQVDNISLRVRSVPERRWAAIDSAWSDKSEVRPGETVSIKVQLRPYRGAPFIQEVPVTIPEQAARGTLRLVVSDSEVLNRLDQYYAGSAQAQFSGLEELIKLLNRERRNDRLYVTLLQPSPTLLVGDKQLPDVPLSAINVLNQRQSPGGALLLGESNIGEWSVEMKQVISGQQYITIQVE